MTQHVQQFRLEPNDARRLSCLCGHLNQNLHLIEQRLGIRIDSRGNLFHLTGPESLTAQGEQVLRDLYAETEGAAEITADQIHLRLLETRAPATDTPGSPDDNVLQTPRMTIRARSQHQRDYLAGVSKRDLNFGIGPAGTGKTFLAVACAVDALQRDQVNRVVLVRPAVEAGERLGFLPGDLQQKVDPYLRPVYDALYEMLGFDQVARLIENHVIEIAPLAYMRGRTLNHSFVILDEAQNTTPEQMKMFLTRIGFGSKAIITGDITQIDLPRGTRSGLTQAMKILKGVPGIGFIRFDASDVVRHPLVQQIVNAYDRFDSNADTND